MFTVAWVWCRVKPGVSGDGPGSDGVVQPECEEAAEVERGDPVVQPQVVWSGAAESQPAVAVGDQPRDRPLHHRAVAAVSDIDNRGGSNQGLAPSGASYEASAMKPVHDRQRGVSELGSGDSRRERPCPGTCRWLLVLGLIGLRGRVPGAGPCVGSGFRAVGSNEKETPADDADGGERGLDFGDAGEDGHRVHGGSPVCGLGVESC